VSPLKRSWSPRGKTPIIRTSITHHARINVIGALAITPGGERIRLVTQSHRHSVTGEQIIAFLKRLLRAIRGPVVLVWDNAPIHTRKSVREFIAAHSRLTVSNFPSYAPELNPVEFVWTQLSEFLAGRAPMQITELAKLVHSGLQRTRASAKRMWACLRGTPLRWRAWRHVR
jgi:transposase